MSRPEQDALETNFAKWRLDRAPALPADKAFERYCAEQVLKDYELSDSEISYGECGATNDGGVDGLYFFAGRRLITDTVDIPEAATTATLEIIQATYESGGFREIRIERFEAFAKDLLDYDTPPSQITHLNPRAQDLIENFRTKYQMMLGTPHELKVVFHYAMRTVVDPNKNTKLASRFKRVQRIVRNSLSNANVSLEYWGSSRLLTRVREQPDQMLKLAVTKHFLTQNGDVVCLAKLADYFKFITKGGDIRASMFEPNVRDYQGRRNDVNKDIRTTLETVTADEFWWLNNGVTILARECPISGNTLTITNPEVVNGLQTSYEICQFFRDHPANLATDTRSLVLRVIIPPNEQVSSKIIKATNFQTEVKGMSLHATEQIHFDIEDKLGLIGLWYDRKKGKYKRLRKPISDIISVVDLARSVIAILLMRPDDARARPQSLLADDKTYLAVRGGTPRISRVAVSSQAMAL
jgi:hypothetical protein